MIRQLCVFVLVGCAGSARMQAQEALTLAQAQAEARVNAPQVRELEARVRSMEGLAAQASRVFRQDPVVSSTYFNGGLLGRPEESSWTIEAKLPVDMSGSWRSRSASAAADVTRARIEGEDGLRLLDESVAIAVADLALQQRFVDRSERLLELYAIAADAAHRHLDVGQGTELDADAADLDLATARVALEQTWGALSGAQARLARLLGRGTTAGLRVADPPEAVPAPERPDFAALVDHDPRVRAIQAEVEAARFERETFQRLATPIPTFGISAGSVRRDIPAGSFAGAPFTGGLTSNRVDREVVFSVSLPVPLFDRQRQTRAQATARCLMAEARLQATRADALAELRTTWAAYESAARALRAVAEIPTVIERDTGFIEQAVRAGAFDAVTRSVRLQRLENAARVADAAVPEYRAARAAWIRRSPALPP